MPFSRRAFLSTAPVWASIAGSLPATDLSAKTPVPVEEEPPHVRTPILGVKDFAAGARGFLETEASRTGDRDYDRDEAPTYEGVIPRAKLLWKFQPSLLFTYGKGDISSGSLMTRVAELQGGSSLGWLQLDVLPALPDDRGEASVILPYVARILHRSHPPQGAELALESTALEGWLRISGDGSAVHCPKLVEASIPSKAGTTTDSVFDLGGIGTLGSLRLISEKKASRLYFECPGTQRWMALSRELAALPQVVRKDDRVAVCFHERDGIEGSAVRFMLLSPMEGKASILVRSKLARTLEQGLSLLSASLAESFEFQKFLHTAGPHDWVESRFAIPG